MEPRTKVTIETEFTCPCCTAQALLRDCQADLFDGSRTWWCENCRAQFHFQFVRFGHPPGGFRIVPEPTFDPSELAGDDLTSETT